MNPLDNLEYQLTIKEIDQMAHYEPLELCGLSGLGIDKMRYLLESKIITKDDQNRVLGAHFLNWVSENGLPVADQS